MDRRTPAPPPHDRFYTGHAWTGRTDDGSLPQALADVSGEHPQGSAPVLLPSVSPGAAISPSVE